MFNWKKILGVLLCLVVICSMASLAISCDEDEEEEELSYTITKTATAVDTAGNGIIDNTDEIIGYTVEVENTGNTTITGVSVSDSLSITLTRQDDDPGNDDADLEEGEIWVYTGSYTVQQSDLDAGSIENTATVSSNELGDKTDTEEVTCGEAPFADDTVKIGVILPLSGPMAMSGGQFKLGIEFVVDQMEAEGALDGADIVVEWGDDGGDPNTAASEMTRLCTAEGVSAVVGPFLPHLGLAACPLADTYKIPNVGIGTGSPEMEDLNLEYYRNVITEAAAGDYSRSMAEFIKYCIDNYDIPHDRIGVIWQDNSTGQTHHDAMFEKLEEYGLDDNVVVDLSFNVTTATSYTTEALQLKAENLDILMGFTLPADSALWVKAMSEQEFYPPIFLTGQMIHWSIYPGLVVSPTIYNDVFSDEHVNSFTIGALHAVGFAHLPGVAAYKEAYDEWITDQGQMNMYEAAGTPIGSQAMYCLWDALEKAGSADPEEINDAFKDLSIPDTSEHFILPTLSPAIEWYPNGTLKNYSGFATQIQDGVEVIVWPEDIAMVEPEF